VTELNNTVVEQGWSRIDKTLCGYDVISGEEKGTEFLKTA